MKWRNNVNIHIFGNLLEFKGCQNLPKFSHFESFAKFKARKFHQLICHATLCALSTQKVESCQKFQKWIFLSVKSCPANFRVMASSESDFVRKYKTEQTEEVLVGEGDETLELPSSLVSNFFVTCSNSIFVLSFFPFVITLTKKNNLIWVRH